MKHPLLQTYGPLDGWMILLLMGGLSIGFFVYQVQKATRLVMIGSPDSVSYTHLTLPTKA